jgi:hypothetical protein
MKDLSEKSALLNSLPAGNLFVEAAGGRGLRRARKLAGLGAASGLLVVALCATTFGPVALGQGQAGAASAGGAPQAQAQASGATKPAAGAGAAQKPADASVSTEPQMQDQSAPAAESLGEAARKARAQKPSASKPKVYTDDSVQNLSGHGVSVVGDGASGGGSSYSGDASAGAGAGAGGGQAPAAGGNQEQYWRGRAAAIRNQMAQCDQKISEIQDEIAKHGAVSVDPMSGAQAGVIFVEDRNAEIKKVEQQKAGLQNQLEALEEEGRKAGADSGWFR